MVWYGMIYMVWYIEWCGMVWYSMEWYAWYGMVWYGYMVWYDMV